MDIYSIKSEEDKIIFVKETILRKIVKGYIVGDLKRLIAIPVVENADGNCNFPIALYVFCAMDFLGYLISEKELSRDSDRIDTYIQLMFTDSAKSKIEPHKEEFANKFRNGLTHEFFPKMAGISRVNPELMTLSKEGYWVLDADILSKMFIESVGNLEKAINAKEFALRMFGRYVQIQERNVNLKNKPDTSTYTSRVYASGATTTTLPYERLMSEQNYSKGDAVVAGISNNLDKSQFAVATYDKIADKYTQKYFNDLTDIPYIDKFLALLPKSAKVLDIGCGPGTFTKYLLEKGFYVEGIDLSSEMLRLAKEKVPQAKFAEIDMRKLTYPDESFDGLLVAYSLIHIPSEEIPATLKGFYRILKSGGVVLIIAQKGEPDKIVDEPLKEGEKIFINFFTKDRLTKFLTDAGFKVEYQEETATKDPDSLSDSVIYTIARKFKP